MKKLHITTLSAVLLGVGIVLAGSGCSPKSNRSTSSIDPQFERHLTTLRELSGTPAGGTPETLPPVLCKLPKISFQAANELGSFLNESSDQIQKSGNSELRERFLEKDIKGNVLRPALPDGASVEPWSQKDLAQDKAPGTSTEKAYQELGISDRGEVITVAVIDSGMDIQHEVLAPQIHDQSWNFLGSKDGKNLYSTNLEITRELRRMKKIKAIRDLTPAEAQYLVQVEADYNEGIQGVRTRVASREKGLNELQTAFDTLRMACGTSLTTIDQVASVQSEDEAVLAAKKVALQYLSGGWTIARFKASIDHWKRAIDTYYNLDFDPSAIVGDNPDQLDEQGYGNSNVMPVGEDEAHATHVAGIIGAVRGAVHGIEHGIQGQASRVKILSLRAVPDGDERDKDVGNAIRYAADHGARVINMSFGKSLSPNKEYVWDSIRYAGARNVLIVHAAGNDSLDNDKNTHYPSRVVTDQDGNVKEVLENVLEVGASSRFYDVNLPAEFSDFGQTTVDLFAPGAQILSSIPHNKYAEFDGTSMACPEVAGVAALVLSQYPGLTALQLKKLLMDSVSKTPAPFLVSLPGGGAHGAPSLVDFATLSVTGGLLNAYTALKMAASQGLK